MNVKPDVGWAMRACPRRSADPAYGSGPWTGRAMAAAGGGTWERSRADSASLSPSIGNDLAMPCTLWVGAHGRMYVGPRPWTWACSGHGANPRPATGRLGGRLLGRPAECAVCIGQDLDGYYGRVSVHGPGVDHARLTGC